MSDRNDSGAIHEPLKQYVSHFRDRFRQISADFLADAVKRSQVDAALNVKTVARIKALKKKIEKAESVLGFLRFLKGLLIFLAAAGILTGLLYVLPMFWNDFPDFRIPQEYAAAGAAVTVLALLLIFCVLNKKIAVRAAALEQHKAELAETLAEAWLQMEPLNCLFRWDTVIKLVMQACPLLSFDPYFSVSRMDDLCRNYGWTAEDPNRSVLFCRSGSIKKNPFVMAEALFFYWDTKIYHGHLEISWTETESYTDAEGHRRTRKVRRYQTLTASVEKPYPAYERNVFTVFGHDAAPDLCFSREPGELSGLEDGFWNRRKIKSAVKALRKRSKDLNNSFTIMANEEFDALFHAVNRNHEQQFRLLFTPLAQQEMLALLRDRKHGYGDDFKFVKQGKINIIPAKHLYGLNLSADPDLFRNYDLAEIKRVFTEFSNEYFRALYFAFAPLFAIPLYQQERSAYAGYGTEETSSPWEHESLANYYGQAAFAHPDSVTENILKTKETGSGGVRKVTVTAHGFAGYPRTDYVSVYGGDGRWHDVPVHWTEYLHVSRETPLMVTEHAGDEEQEKVRTLMRKYNLSSSDILSRKNMLSFLPGK